MFSSEHPLKSIFSLTGALALALSITACDLEDVADDEASENGVTMRAVDIDCTVVDAVGCSSGNDGGSLVVGVVEDCDTFSSSSQVLAVANGTLDCDSLGCELSAVIQPSDFTPSAITAGTYDLYAFIDEDEDSEPDTLTEPVGCYQDVEIDGSSTQITVTDWE